jgi:hypothetical protein
VSEDDRGLQPLPFTQDEIWTLPLDDLLGPDWRAQVQQMVDALRGMDTEAEASEPPPAATTD